MSLRASVKGARTGESVYDTTGQPSEFSNFQLIRGHVSKSPLAATMPEGTFPPSFVSSARLHRVMSDNIFFCYPFHLISLLLSAADSFPSPRSDHCRRDSDRQRVCGRQQPVCQVARRCRRGELARIARRRQWADVDCKSRRGVCDSIAAFVFGESHRLGLHWLGLEMFLSLTHARSLAGH